VSAVSELPAATALAASGHGALAAAPLEVPIEVVAEVHEFAPRPQDVPDDLEHVDLAKLAWPHTTRLAGRIAAELRLGAGYQRLTLPEGHGLTPPQCRLLFLAVASRLGGLLTQYGRLYAVKDRGADYRSSALPVSMTRDRTGFHTDSSARGVLPDYVGLLCERPAREGGDSLVSDAMAVRAELARRAADALALLQREYVRDLVTPGAEVGDAALQRNRFAVFAEDDEPAGWTLRYMRYWLERGQERAGAPVAPEVTAALDLLDELLAASRHVVRFRLEAGDMLWVNNRTMAHDRDAFVDDPAAPRLLWRTWVQRVAGPA